MRDNSENYKTEQEKFWAGDFGDQYTERNADPRSIASRAAFFADVLNRTVGVRTVLEIGANIGQNLQAIRALLPECKFTAVELNSDAAAELENIPNTRVLRQSVLDLPIDQLDTHHLTFTAGVLIHINPDRLVDVYDRLYHWSERYVLISEYYNPTPVEVTYRGHERQLFKRDFAGEFMDRFPDVDLVDYGFRYRRDNNFPADDVNWFLLRKHV